MIPRRVRALVLLAVVAVLGVVLPHQRPTVAEAAPAQQQAGPYRHFPETGHNIMFEVKTFYETRGGLETFGLPLTEVITENGQQVQYFERARFEIHPENKGTEYYVLLTRLGAFFTEYRASEPPFLWLAGSPGPEFTFFPESGHSLRGGFRDYWKTRGGLQAFGFPISEEFQEVNPSDGQTYTVQYFERARFEYHPEHAGTKFEIQLGLLGAEYANYVGVSPADRSPANAIQMLGTSTTFYGGSGAERVQNIARAAQRFNGLQVKAGATFSFNAHVGDVSEEAGFVDGYAIVGGKLEKVVGGGLCQVSTTMYRAVFNAGFPIVERYPHTYVVYYYENIMGFDATVFLPEVDFRWRNDLGTDVWMYTETDTKAGRVTFTLWGYGDGRKAKMEGPTVTNKVNPGKPVWQYDKTMKRGAVSQLVHGRPGMDVTMFRVVTKATGQSVRERFFTKYQPWEDFYLFGPGVTPPAGVTIAPPRYP